MNCFCIATDNKNFAGNYGGVLDILAYWNNGNRSYIDVYYVHITQFEQKCNLNHFSNEYNRFRDKMHAIFN